MLRSLAIAAFEIGFLGLVAAVTAKGRFRALALAIVLPSFAVAWQVPREHALVRAIIAIMGSVVFLRVLDLVLAKKERPVRQRVWHALAFIDTTRVRYERPSLDVRALVRTLAYAALACLSLCLVRGQSLEGVWRTVARLFGGVVFVVTLTDAAYGLLTVGFCAAGVVVYDLHRAPVLSRTVQEFWGERWARTVSLYLFTRTFKPFARRGSPRLGLMMSFIASGIFHAYIILPALGWGAAGLWGMYFVVQGVLVLMELALRVRQWPRPLAHGWVAVTMLTTSPLMVLPALPLLGA
jgi:hypothetical protein